MTGDPGRPGGAGPPRHTTVDGSTLPQWWQPLLSGVARARRTDLTRLPTPPTGRQSAVLIALAGPDGHRPGAAARDDDPGPDVLVLQRAATLRKHAGQPAFPGGAADPGEHDPAVTALREASEEVGLDPSTVRVVATLPKLWIPVSGYIVTPVLAWWRDPHPVYPVDVSEVARVERLPLRELADPGNRLRLRHPSGWVGPAFRAGGMLVWGFTAGLLDALLTMGGWALPWDTAAPPLDLPVSADTAVVPDDAGIEEDDTAIQG